MFTDENRKKSRTFLDEPHVVPVIVIASDVHTYMRRMYKLTLGHATMSVEAFI